MYTRPDLRHALEADVPEIDAAVNRHPALIFERFSTIDVDDKPIDMSMIEYAIYVGDYDAFQTLLKTATQNNSLEKFLLQAYPASIKMKFSMDKYYQTCSEFISISREARNNKNNTELQAAYNALIQEQCKIPRHILYEMCGGVTSRNVTGDWSVYTDFIRSVSRQYKAEFRIFKDDYQCIIWSLPHVRPSHIYSKYILGKNVLLTRGDSEFTDHLECGHRLLTGERIQKDIEVIQHLLAIRHAQIAEHLEQLIIEYKLKENDIFEKLDALDHDAIKKFGEKKPDASGKTDEWFSINYGSDFLDALKDKKTPFAEFLLSMNGKENFNKQIKDLHLSLAEEAAFFKLKQRRSNQYMNIPVVVNEAIYDFSEVMKRLNYRSYKFIDPETNKQIEMHEITPAYKLIEKIQTLIVSHRNKIISATLNQFIQAIQFGDYYNAVACIKDNANNADFWNKMQGPDGEPILVYILTCNQPRIACALLAVPGIITKGLQMKDGEPILIYAARLNLKTVVNKLLECAYTMANVRDKDGNTAIMIAAIQGHKAIVELLLNYYHHLGLLAPNSQGVLAEEIVTQDPEISRLITIRAKEELINELERWRDKTEKSVIYAYIEKLSKSALDYFSETYDCSILSAAVNIPVAKMIETLLIKGVDVNIGADRGMDTPLHKLVENWHHESDEEIEEYNNILRLLFEHKDLNIHAKDSRGYTPFLVAVEEFNIVAVNHFIQHRDFDIAITDNHGKSALHIIKKCIERCKRHGVEDPEGIQVYETLKKYYANKLFAAMRENQADKFWELTKICPQVLDEIRDIEGNPLLHVALCQSEAIAIPLIKSKINVNCQKQLEIVMDDGSMSNATYLTGPTTLLLAARRGQAAIVAALLERPDTNIDATDETFQTSFMIAAQHGHLEVVRAMLNSKRIDVTMKNLAGLTALDLALNENHMDIVDMIKQFTLPNASQNPLSFYAAQLTTSISVDASLNILSK